MYVISYIYNMKTNKNISRMSPLEDIIKQTERCLHFIAERETYPDDELRLLLEMCQSLPENILHRCPQIIEIISFADDFDRISFDTRLQIPQWIMDDMTMLGYSQK